MRPRGEAAPALGLALTPATSPFALRDAPPLHPTKFRDPFVTAAGKPRARVRLGQLETLWLNTGTLCNLACPSCYIFSSPRNDALAYLTLDEAAPFLLEAAAMGARTIGLTGGEPFINPEIVPIMQAALDRGFELIVLTNAMRPMRCHEAALAALASEHGERIVVRVSVDSAEPVAHDAERGDGSWDISVAGLVWLARAGFRVAVAGRRVHGDCEARYRDLFERLGVAVDHLVLFPTMDAAADVPEISEECWAITGTRPDALMCATSRMVVKPRGAARPHVVACTLLPHDARFALGPNLADAPREITLNHPHCARFCVLGGASCTG